MEEKLSALQTLETMAWDASMATHIAKDGVAKMIGPLLLDNNSSIRAATAAALRQVADIGGEKAHTDLMKDDIMTPLSALLKQVRSIDNSLYYYYYCVIIFTIIILIYLLYLLY